VVLLRRDGARGAVACGGGNTDAVMRRTAEGGPVAATMNLSP
jgi:hypothetical protein